MKKIIFASLFLGFSILTINAQLDRSVRPEPGPAPEIKLEEFESFTLENGLEVIVVENRQNPVVSFQLTLDIDRVLEGDAKGYVSLAGNLMREGTENRTKQEIDEAIDFLGANLSTHSRGMFASSLTRHKHDLLDIMADVLYNPTFPEEEMQRRISQTRTSLQNTRTDGGSIVSNISRTLAFGDEHPYGEVTTEETLDNITVDMLKDYYNTYFKPNVAYMVIVGDIDKDEAKNIMEQYFAEWEPGDVPTHSYPTPEPPEGNVVAFGERRGASQSNVSVTYPVYLPPGHEDAIKVSVMNGILGGGVFSGRLMTNLREDKGYTYGARSSLGTNPLVSRFTAGAEVRNEVTDSTITEILYEMDRLINNPVEQNELDIIQSFMTGQFARSLERPQTIARFALNIKRYDLPEDYYATYLKRLNDITIEDVQKTAQKYIKPENSYIVVAGNRNEVPETLKKFSMTGEVKFFDEFGRPIVEQEIIKADDDITAETVINNYLNAIGGKNNIKKIKDIKQVMKTSVQGTEITITSYKKEPNYLKVETSMNGNVLSTQLFDGEKAYIKSMMGDQTFTEGQEFEAMKMQAIMNLELEYEDYGIEKKLEGIVDINGISSYKIKITSAEGEKSYDYYDVETELKIKSETPESVSRYKDYKTVAFMGKEGKEIKLKFPHKVYQEAQQQSLELETLKIKINSGLTKEEFQM